MKYLIVLTVIVLAQQPAKLPKSSGVPERATSVVSGQTNGTHSNEDASHPLSQSANAINGDTDATPRDENIGIQRKLVLFTGLLVLAGFATAALIFWQSWETRRSADTANRNIIAVMDERRARVEMIAGGVALVRITYDKSDMPPSPSHINWIGISLKNGGPTMAFIREVGGKLVEAGRELNPSYAECLALGFVGTIPAGSGTSQIAISLQPQAFLSGPQIAEIREARSFIHFYGFARYQDVYKRVYRVQVHLRWVVLQNFLQGQVPECWELAGKPEDNSDTEEKPRTKNWIERLNERLDKFPNPN